MNDPEKSKPQISKQGKFVLPLILFLSILAHVGCVNRKYNSNTFGFRSISTTSCEAQNADRSFPLVSVPDKTTLTYHWTFEKTAETTDGAVTYVKNLLAKVASEPEGSLFRNAFGPGLYVAADPVTSMSYGDTLLIVPVRPRCQFGFSDSVGADSERDQLMVKSSLAGVVYPFGGENNKALVLRTPAAIELEKIESIPMAALNKKSLAQIPILPIGEKVRWSKVLRHYGKHFPTFLLTRSSDSQTQNILRKSIDSSGRVTDFWYMIMRTLELNVSEFQGLILLQKALRGQDAKDFFKFCYESTYQKGDSPSLYKGCLLTAWSKALSAVFPDAQANENSMSHIEANRILTVAGILPDGWNPNSPILESGQRILQDVRNDKNFVIAAEHIYRLLSKIDAEDFSTTNTLNAWSAPTN